MMTPIQNSNSFNAVYAANSSSKMPPHITVPIRIID